MKAATITQHEGLTVFAGTEAVEVFRLTALVSALRLEQGGLRLSRRVSALKIAKGVTGNRSNDRGKQILLLEILIDEAKRKVTYDAGPVLVPGPETIQ